MTRSLTPAYDAIRAWATEWDHFYDGRRLGILKEVIRGHRMAASIVRSANPNEAADYDLAVAYLEALLTPATPAPPEGAGDERSSA